MKRPLLLAVLFICISSSVSLAKVVKQFYPDGSIYSSQVYYDSGIPEGPYKIYWPNGRLKQKTLYRNGRAYISHHWSTSGVRLD